MSDGPKEDPKTGTLVLRVRPGKSVEINDQYTYVTPVPWELSISDDHKKLVFTSFVYEELRAIRKAVERLGLDRSFVEGLFFGLKAAVLAMNDPVAICSFLAEHSAKIFTKTDASTDAARKPVPTHSLPKPKTNGDATDGKKKLVSAKPPGW